jgi:hypothetical protein
MESKFTEFSISITALFVFNLGVHCQNNGFVS